MTKNTLTIQELEAAHFAEFDLGPGYPQLDPPGFVKRSYRDAGIEELSLLFAPAWSRSEQMSLDQDLDLAVRRFIDFPLDLAREERGARFTFSGSIALDRAISASERVVRARGLERLLVITTTPCIDIMRLFLAERAAVTARFVRSDMDGVIGRLSLHGILQAIEEYGDLRPTHGLVVLLTSPENPTGECWSELELRSVHDAVVKQDGILIVDHTFVVAGVQTKRVSRIWDAVPEGQWISVWDTGKTFGLNEDKIGVLFCGHDSLLEALDDSLAVLQFGIARRQKLFFASVLHAARYYGHVSDLRTVISENLQALVGVLGDRVRAPLAGSMALVDVAPGDPETVRRKLLANGVGVVSGDVFFHDDWRPSSWIRVALARDRDHFRAAVDKAAVVLGSADL